VVRACHQCQMVKRIGSTKYDIEEFKSIPIHDLFYHIALNVVGLLLETKTSNKYLNCH
jgi:hypothetical protein